jgi:hypothetical protein
MSDQSIDQLAASLRQLDTQQLLRRTLWYLERLIPFLTSDTTHVYSADQINADKEKLQQLATALGGLDVGLPFSWLIVRKRGLEPAEVYAFSNYAEAAGQWQDAQGEGFSTYLCQVVARDGGPAEHA